MCIKKTCTVIFLAVFYFLLSCILPKICVFSNKQNCKNIFFFLLNLLGDNINSWIQTFLINLVFYTELKMKKLMFYAIHGKTFLGFKILELHKPMNRVKTFCVGPRSYLHILVIHYPFLCPLSTNYSTKNAPILLEEVVLVT